MLSARAAGRAGLVSPPQLRRASYAYEVQKWLHVFYLVEVLSDPAVLTRLADTKASGEVKSLQDFYTNLQNDPDRAFYG